MKKALFLFLLITIAAEIKAQDTVIKYDGSVIVAKVAEITATEIKYHKYDFLSGPMYVENKFDVQCIKYASGLREYFERASQTRPLPNLGYSRKNDYGNEIKTFHPGHYWQNGHPLSYHQIQLICGMTNNKKITNEIRESKKCFTASFSAFGFFPMAIGTIYCISMANQQVYNSQTRQYSDRTDRPLYVAAGAACGILTVACPIYGFWQRHQCIEHINKAVKLYNEKY